MPRVQQLAATHSLKICFTRSTRTGMTLLPFRFLEDWQQDRTQLCSLQWTLHNAVQQTVEKLLPPAVNEEKGAETMPSVNTGDGH